MRWVIIFSSVFLLFLVQDGILSQLSNGLVYINLALLFMALFVLLGTFKESLVVALFVGFLLDLNSGYTDALMMVVVLLDFLSLQVILRRIVTRQANLPLVYGFAALSVILFYFFLWGAIAILKVLDIPEFLFNITWGKCLAEVSLSCLLTYPIFLYYNYINSILNRYLPRSI